MKKLLTLLFLTLSIEYAQAADEIYLDCSDKYDVSNGSRDMTFIKLDTSSKQVNIYKILLFYKNNPEFYCTFSKRDECIKKGILPYTDGYQDRFGELRTSIKNNLSTQVDSYSWKTVFPCCGRNWKYYSSTNGIQTSKVTRDTIKYYSSHEISEKKGKSCEILDKDNFDKEVEHYRTRWEKLSEKAVEEQLKKNKI
jgi:hypothetical protein